MISKPKQDLIQSSLDQIERDHQVQVFFACESGSRAWGFASADSDYDVRFLYLHPPEWYLSINLEKKPDVIELPIEEDLDVSGWDLRKALQLLRKSNPPLMEWLGSPIVYREKGPITQKIREIVPTYYSNLSARYHYLSMAKNNFRQYFKGPLVSHKKYFYVLRPLLAIQWLEKGLGVVPTEFQVLVDRLLEEEALRKAIDDLKTKKSSGSELDKGPRIEPISHFIEQELDRLNQIHTEKNHKAPPAEPLDKLFRESLIFNFS